MSDLDNMKTLQLSHFDTTTKSITYAETELFEKKDNNSFPTQYEFTITGVIGEGGMGMVYLAEQSHPKREVALKRLKNANPFLRKALYNEAMITGALDHPTIIPIYSLGLTGEHAPEVVMKRIEGGTMLSFISNTGVETRLLRKMVSALCQVCNGLDYAHSKRVFHRDIKPENIMIGEYGEVYLLDWGIAVNKEDGMMPPIGLVGTPAFMAPEMLSGDPNHVDARTDVYLLGATLHQVLTGKPRHDGKERTDFMSVIRNSAPAEYAESVPEILAELANQSCHPNPDQRPQTPAEFRQRLQQFLDYSQAYGICDAAEEQLETLEQLIQLEEPNTDQRMAIHKHYNLSRFGFEQALDIWPGFTEAKQQLNKAIAAMATHYLLRQQLEAAQPLIEELDDVPQQILEEMQRQISAKLALEKEIEVYRKTGGKIQSSDLFRRLFTIGISAACGIFIFLLFQIEDLDPNTLSPESLFYQSVLMSVPIIPMVFIARSRLLVSPNGRRAAIGVVGAMITVMLHRWIALSYNEVPASIIVVDLFILGLGLVNTAPAIRYGRLLGLLCMSIGLINHYVPITFWPGSLIVAIAIGISVLGDWRRNWNE